MGDNKLSSDNKLSTDKGYIYIRNNFAYEFDNVYKLGKTSKIYKRDEQYKTGEYRHGNYVLVIEIPLKYMNIIDKTLTNTFKDFNTRCDGGIEFYKQSIKEEVIKYFETKLYHIKYKILSEEEIKKIENYNRRKILTMEIKRILKKRLRINYTEVIKRLKQKNMENTLIDINKAIDNKPKPREIQKYIIEIIVKYLEQNDIGKLILPCGIGKTLILYICNTKIIKY